MSEIKLIANSGIQTFTFPLSIDIKDRYLMSFRESYNDNDGQFNLELLHQVKGDDYLAYFRKKELFDNGFLSASIEKIDLQQVHQAGIKSLFIDDEACPDVAGELFTMNFRSRLNKLDKLEGQWLPLPYFNKKGLNNFRFSGLNWARMKMVFQREDENIRHYNVVLSFDTRCKYEVPDELECPNFLDAFQQDLQMELCSNDFLLMDYCQKGEEWSYIEDYIFKTVYPDTANIYQLRGEKFRHSYIASYIFLISYLANNNSLPAVKLYRDRDVESKAIDMIIDIGNSRTTALLMEQGTQNFNNIKTLELIDYTELEKGIQTEIKTYNEPFDMRLVFRRVNFGSIGHKGSRQFVYPSFVRLGLEAKSLIHQANESEGGINILSTYSSPKRYLWDSNPSKEEWRFYRLKGEEEFKLSSLHGIIEQLKGDGSIDHKHSNGGGIKYNYSRRSLMTFSFLEMLVQARGQVNSLSYRSDETGFGDVHIPRKIKKIIVTCPTAMSRLEREALISCAKDAVKLLDGFDDYQGKGLSIEVVPNLKKSFDDEEEVSWYYDEATCAQLVYMYGKVGDMYKGSCTEFFNLYGKKDQAGEFSLTIGSLDIGAGTSDVMINKYAYKKGDLTTITPDPLFFDSYYYAGDDMLRTLIHNILLMNADYSAFRRQLKDLTIEEYYQKIKNFFGQDYGGQTRASQNLRRDFNLQYSVPLMTYFLELISNKSKATTVRFEDVFATYPPSESVIAGFEEHFNLDLRTLEWEFNPEFISLEIHKTLEPLLRQIATIMFSFSCDIILLSGRPASLPAIKEIFLKYYAVSPSRLVVLNNSFVGSWYPFSENTGYIKNAKTIVAMGGIVGHYTSTTTGLNNFVVDMSKLRQNLGSTANFIHSKGDDQYIITKTQEQGRITVTNLPKILNVRQIDLENYPTRPLFSIDFNKHRMAESIKKQFIIEGNPLSDPAIHSIVEDKCAALRARMPFYIELGRSLDNQEELEILSIMDRNDEEVQEKFIEIHIQSLGTDDKYWLDSGAFDF